VSLPRWRRRIERALLEARFAAFKPGVMHQFYIVTAAYNVEDFLAQSVESVCAQNYPASHVTHVVVDDASTDGTYAVALALRERFADRALEVRRTSENRGGCANYTAAFRAAAPASIVLQVDGDDWLPDPDVLAFLNMVYHDPEVWLTYNSWQTPAGERAGNCQPVPERVVRNNTFREAAWVSSHLHSFRAQLFAHVHDESMRDPATGEHWRAAVDMAQFLPMLELAGDHALHIERPLYVYNLHGGSIMNTRRKEQADCEQRIRSLERYVPLGALEGALAP